MIMCANARTSSPGSTCNEQSRYFCRQGARHQSGWSQRANPRRLLFRPLQILAYFHRFAALVCSGATNSPAWVLNITPYIEGYPLLSQGSNSGLLCFPCDDFPKKSNDLRLRPLLSVSMRRICGRCLNRAPRNSL
jgi:hypothetical protein